MTTYHVPQLTDLPLFARIYPDLRELFHTSVPRLRQSNQRHLSLHCYCKIRSGFFTRKRVAEINPYHTPYIAWVDIGLYHVVGDELDLLSLSSAGETHHPSGLCFGMPYMKEHIPPRDEIMRRFWGRIAGGFWTMPMPHAVVWERLCSSYLCRWVAEGYYPFECEVLLRLLVRTGKLSGQTDDDVTKDEIFAVPKIIPYQAEYSQLISRHPMFDTSKT